MGNQFFTCMLKEPKRFENFDHNCNYIEEVFNSMLAFKHKREKRQIILAIIPKENIERIDYFGAKELIDKYEQEGER